MISLEKSNSWKEQFAKELYCNNATYDDFIEDDIIRAYYFGFFIETVCKELESDGFKTSPVNEQLLPLRWNVRRHKYQIQFWKRKYVELHGDMVIPLDLDMYILNMLIVDDYDELLKIASLLGRDSYVLITENSEQV